MKAGARQVTEIQRHLKYFVQDLFQGKLLPDFSERQWFPSDEDVRNVMKGVKANLTRNDQENLADLLASTIKADDKYFYQPSTDTENFLLCIQTAWQRRLLKCYGGEMVLLDATYRTSKYALPLFFLTVRTNVCYAVVAIFIPQAEDSFSVGRALKIIHEWNPEWKPSSFLVDYCAAEINAIENIFSDCQVFLCDFHREKAWFEWVRKAEHGVAHCVDEVLTMLRRVAESHTLGMYQQNIEKVKQSEIWQSNGKLRDWFESRWISIKERWVKCFRNEYLKVAINTNNGVERQNKWLKESYLAGYRNCSIRDLIEVLLTRFLPKTYQKYCELNIRSLSTYRSYSSDVPTFLHDRPKYFVSHVMKRMSSNIERSDIREGGNGLFHVRSEITPANEYKVWFGSAVKAPFCECMDWRKSKLPCKHMCAVFLLTDWKWDDLHPNYRDLPIFNIDSEVCGHTKTISTENIHVASKTNDVNKVDREGAIANSDGNSNESSTDDLDGGGVLGSENEAENGSSASTPSTPQKMVQLPLRRALNQRAVDRCEIQMKCLRDLIYQVTDVDFLHEIEKKLCTLKEECSQKVPSSNNLPVRQLTPKKLKRKLVMPSTRAGLPLYKRRKVKRFGVLADIKKKYVDVNVPVQTAKTCFPEKDCDRKKTGNTTKGQKRAIEKNSTTEAWTKVDDITLYTTDQQVLMEGSWLNDNHINAAQRLVKKAFPHVDGLQNTLTEAIPLTPQKGESLQIHHVNGNHWAVSSSIGNQITVYESLHSSIGLNFRQQLTKLYSNYADKDDCVTVQLVTSMQYHHSQ